MNDLLLFMAGGLYVFIIAMLVALIEYLKTRLKDKNK